MGRFLRGLGTLDRGTVLKRGKPGLRDDRPGLQVLVLDYEIGENGTPTTCPSSFLRRERWFQLWRTA